MNRIPVIPTIIVTLAIVIMVLLGIWQLQRAQWKERLLAEYAAAEGLAPVAWPRNPKAPGPLPLYRKSSLDCLSVSDWRSISGRNASNMAGNVHVATCRLNAKGQETAQVVTGWSISPANPDWAGGPVSGTIAPDAKHGVRLVTDRPVVGLAANARPSLENIPNNHLAYAVQWFFFAAIAGGIYMLALRGRRRRKAE